MTMLSAILTAVSIIELANKGYEWIDNLQSVIDKALCKRFEEMGTQQRGETKIDITQKKSLEVIQDFRI